WLFGLCLFLGVAAFFALGGQRYFTWEFLRGHFDQFRSEADAHLALALALFLATYVSVAAHSPPVASSLSLLAGALFGRWLGTGVVLVAATTGGDAGVPE